MRQAEHPSLASAAATWRCVGFRPIFLSFQGIRYMLLESSVVAS